MLIRLLLLPPLDYACARMATSLTKISTPENKKKSFFFSPFLPFIEKRVVLGFTLHQAFLSHTQTVCHVCRVFVCDPFRPSGLRRSSLSPNLSSFYIFPYAVGQLDKQQNVFLSYLRDVESY